MTKKNFVPSEIIRSFVDRIERINQDIEELQRDRQAVYADLKAQGYHPKGIRYVVQVRKMKPHDRQEAEMIRDTYMNAAGLAEEPPLFRQLDAVARDASSEDKLIDLFKRLAPQKGDFICRIGNKPMRIFRDKDGNPQSEEWTAVEASEAKQAPQRNIPKSTAEVPDVDENGAFELGNQFAKDNRPIINNPFPFGDKRRAKFDEGWRKGSGNDGMGKED